ncbi:hypothetical protein HK098_000253 [Nowakowskiella sp. JEL0407]|nr:hypothetical protein HK098_000253 [Nowakowskiella sp. JEL0407]
MGNYLPKLPDPNAMARAQKENMERQQRMMMASQVALTRDRLNWMGAGYGIALSGVLAARIRGHTIPAAAYPGLFLIFPLILGYQIDLAYFNKADRIRKEVDKILETENQWFAVAERKARERDAAKAKK